MHARTDFPNVATNSRDDGRLSSDRRFDGEPRRRAAFRSKKYTYTLKK
jgi:hypothetical protein